MLNKINKSFIWYFLPSLILIMFGGLSVFIDSTAVYFDVFNMLCALGVIVIMYIAFFRKRKQYSRRNILILLLGILMIAETNLRSSWNFSHRCVYAISILFCIIAQEDKNVINIFKNIIKILFVFYACYAVVTILCALIPGLYEKIVDLFFQENRQTLMKQWRRGGNAGLTKHYSTNGMLLATGFCVSFAKYISSRNIRWQISSILLYVAVVLSGKRAHFLFCSFAAFVLIYISYTDRSIVLKWIKFLFVIISLLIAGYIIVSLHGEDIGIVSRFEGMSEEDDISRGRYVLWHSAVYAFFHNPIFGIGWKQYCMKIGPLLSKGSILYDTHNVYIQLLCETGIIGATVYYTWFIVIFIKTIKVFKRIKNNNESGIAMISFSLMYQVFFYLYCITGNPLYDYMTAIPYFLSCSISIFYDNMQRPFYYMSRILRKNNFMHMLKKLKYG